MFDGKLNIVCARCSHFIAERSKFLIPSYFQKRQEKQKKFKENRNFLRKISFRQNVFYYFIVTQKTLTID